jgi:GNAT superfamily N-acetyltransferase
MTDLGNGYTLSADKSLLQIDVIHNYLSKESYWAKNIPVDTVKKSIEGAFCIGIYNNGQQVGFARVISDYATFGYLADVFVLPAHRGKGLSKAMMKFIMEEEWVQGLRNIMLGTQDAHGLYAQFGFTTVNPPDRYMSVFKMRVYEERKV